MSAINATKNPANHSRIKHIEVRYHFIRENVKKGDTSFEFVLFGIFAKPLTEKQFKFIRTEL